MGKRHICPGCGAEFNCETGRATFGGNDEPPDPELEGDDEDDADDEPPAPPPAPERPHRFRRGT
jgi:hypothetical protein